MTTRPSLRRWYVCWRPPMHAIRLALQACEMCGDGSDDVNILICDGCEKGYHLYCLMPRLQAAPEGDWSGLDVGVFIYC